MASRYKLIESLEELEEAVECGLLQAKYGTEERPLWRAADETDTEIARDLFNGDTSYTAWAKEDFAVLVEEDVSPTVVD